MDSYSLEEIELIKGKHKFYKLVINDECQFEKFLTSLENQYSSKVRSIWRRMMEVSQGRLLPKDKFNFISGTDCGYPVFEIKKDFIRVYCTKNYSDDYIIVYAGKKDNQKKDIKKVIGIIKNFLRIEED